jgi:predicted dehydrogenase
MNFTRWGLDPVGWGFLGAGHLVTKATAAAVHEAPEAKLMSVAASDMTRARAVEPQRAYDSYAAVLEDPRVEVVYIALSNDLHLKWILDSLQAGKHVLCEKPMTMSAADSQTAFDAAAASGLLLVEATWALWHPRIKRIVELVRGGTIGEVAKFDGSFTFDRVRPGNYRLNKAQGGGAFLDTGIYPLHVLTDAAPSLNQKVVQAERDENDTGADMTTKAAIEFKSGAEATVLSSFVMKPQQTLRFEGTTGLLEVTDGQAYTSWRTPSQLKVDRHVEDFPAVDAYQLMFSAVSRRVRGEDVWVLPAPQSMKVANLVDAVYQA